MVLPKMLVDAEVVEQKTLMSGVYLMTMSAPEIANAAKAGNFVQVKAEWGSTLLRRPLGIANVNKNEDKITLIYRKIGKGTSELSKLKAGDIVSVLGPLGNSFFDFFGELKNPLIVGGGMGLSPLLFFAKSVQCASVLMGARNSEELFWEEIFKPYVKEIFITTEDGSRGEKGFNVLLLPKILETRQFDLIVTCGPDPMMKKVAEIAKDYNIPVEVSLERRMGCGLGACLSCAIDTANGRKKVCKDGPVFKGEEVFF